MEINLKTVSTVSAVIGLFILILTLNTKIFGSEGFLATTEQLEDAVNPIQAQVRGVHHELIEFRLSVSNKEIDYLLKRCGVNLDNPECSSGDRLHYKKISEEKADLKEKLRSYE